MINAMLYITVGVSKYLEIMSKLDLDISIKYTERILRGPELNKFRQVLLECKESAKGLVGDQWNLGSSNSVTMEQL